SRLETYSQLESGRDVLQPRILSSLKRRRATLKAYAAKSPENERRAKEAIFGYENSIKARQGMLEALQDPKAMAAKAEAEKDLGGRGQEEVAHEAVAGTKLKDVAARKALVAGGRSAVAASKDSMIVLARKIDPLARQARTFKEDEVDAVQKRAGERIAQARWK